MLKIQFKGIFVKRVLLSIFLFSALLLFSGCSEKEDAKNVSQNGGSTVTKNANNENLSFDELPIKKDLSYIATIDNNFGYLLTEEKYNNIFKIWSEPIEVALGITGFQINNPNIDEFGIDDYKKQLQEVFSKNIQTIKENYIRNTPPKKIRIVDLSIPATIKKNGELVIQNEDQKPLYTLNSISEIKMTQIANKFLGEEVIPYVGDEKCSFGAKVNLPEEYSNIVFIIAAKNHELIKEIRNKNRGQVRLTDQRRIAVAYLSLTFQALN